MRHRVVLERAAATPSDKAFEVVERKGLGHPDSICDAVMEEASSALARAYLETFGAVQHFNLDKALLAAGRSDPAFGGGSITEPMRFIFGDRAVYEHGGRRVPVMDVLKASAEAWISSHLPHVEPQKHVVFQNEVRPASAELVGLFANGACANDTSVGVGFAPLTETERLVLEAERFLNSRSLKNRFPEVGEDVKVMALRRGASVDLTVAMAVVDRFVESEQDYFQSKAEIHFILEKHLRAGLEKLDSLTVHLNALDRPGFGSAGTYLTVTGTSAESGDSGQVGRGNRVSGLFSARPVSNEAHAGKNPVCHVGKIYNVLAQRIAIETSSLAGVREATVYLGSRIGAPVAEPSFCAAELVLEREVAIEDVSSEVHARFDEALAGAPGFYREWIQAPALAE